MRYQGLGAIDHGLWEAYCRPIWLGRFVEGKYRILDHLGREMRRTHV